MNKIYNNEELLSIIQTMQADDKALSEFLSFSYEFLQSKVKKYTSWYSHHFYIDDFIQIYLMRIYNNPAKLLTCTRNVKGYLWYFFKLCAWQSLKKDQMFLPKVQRTRVLTLLDFEDGLASLDVHGYDDIGRINIRIDAQLCLKKIKRPAYIRLEDWLIIQKDVKRYFYNLGLQDFGDIKPMSEYDIRSQIVIRSVARTVLGYGDKRAIQ